MTTAPPATILANIQKFLLLPQAKENAKHNVLAMLGLFALDFPAGGVELFQDASEITVVSKKFPEGCNCDHDDPKVVNVGQGLHTARCNRSMLQALTNHPCLSEFEDDDDDTTWTFVWPRDVSHFRAVIQTRFAEVKDDTLWANFKTSWKAITDTMPEAEIVEDPESAPVRNDDPDTIDFDSDIEFGSDEPIPETEHADPTPDPLEDLTPPPHATIEVVHGAGNPAIEAAAQAVLDDQEAKRGRGRPKGSTKAAKQAKTELAPGDFTPEETPTGGMAYPAIRKFAGFASEELNRLCGVLRDIMTADGFPLETIESFKSSLDRLALKAAHLQFKGRQDEDESNTLDPMIEVTLMNLTASANVALRDLNLSPEKAESWQKYQKDMKEVIGKADSMQDLMGQVGMGPVITGK